MPLPKFKDSFRSKRAFILLGALIGIGSLLFTSVLARQIREKEQFEVEIWSYAMQYVPQDFDDPNPYFFSRIFEKNGNKIPYIIINQEFEPTSNSPLIPDKVVNNPRLLRKTLDKMARVNEPLEIRLDNIFGFGGERVYYIYYGRSFVSRALDYYPAIQITIIALFIVFAFIAFSSAKQNETNRIWVGMAKETAHQLGTPTSSLLGWIEYLRSQPVDQQVVGEMDNDLKRLLKVVDRFSKIGAATELAARDLTELVGGTVAYFRSRIPRNVELRYDRGPVGEYALVNDALFEWVIENLLKNALDALQGKGVITVRVYREDPWVNIDVADTGKGLSRANFKRIFEPGFTTKTRGWGLGLSLSARIVERYHKGKIFVVDSEPNKGTTMRVSLLREKK